MSARVILMYQHSVIDGLSTPPQAHLLWCSLRLKWYSSRQRGQKSERASWREESRSVASSGWFRSNSLRSKSAGWKCFIRIGWGGASRVWNVWLETYLRGWESRNSSNSARVTVISSRSNPSRAQSVCQKRLHYPCIFGLFTSDELKLLAYEHRIAWKYSLPKSPWWNEFTKRLGDLRKGVLMRVLACESLDFEEMTIALAEVEKILFEISMPNSFVFFSFVFVCWFFLRLYWPDIAEDIAFSKRVYLFACDDSLSFLRCGACYGKKNTAGWQLVLEITSFPVTITAMEMLMKEVN